MFLGNLYAPKKKKKQKKIGDFFDENQLTKEDLLDLSDKAINERLKGISNTNKVIDDNIYVDLELFSNESVFDSINRTSTSLGNISLRNLIKNPQEDIDKLNKHQSIIKVFLENNQLYEELSKSLSEISEIEKQVMWLYKERSKEELQIINRVYFKNKFIKRFNKDENILLIYNYFVIIFSPLYGILTPLLFFIAPYLYLRFFSNIEFDIQTYYKMLKASFFGMPDQSNMFGQTAPAWSRYVSLMMTVFMYFQNVYNSFEVSVHTSNIIDEFHKKLNSMSRFLDIFDDLYFKTEKILNIPTKVVRCFKRLKNKLFNMDPFMFSNKGTILVCFNEVLENKNELLDIFEYIGKLDSYISIIKLYKEFSDKRCKYCLPKFVKNDKPLLKTNNIWHSYLNPKNVIGNDIQMGGKNPNNIILTGPNAGGKSTFIKSLTLGILMAQTLGIVSADLFEFTPFYIINTYLNIPDCKGKESLFEAEMHRSKDHIDKLKTLDQDKFSFVVMDEIFSSTNPEEGIAGGYSIGESLGKFKNSMSCITTHFSYITNLQNTSDFLNYKIPITYDEDKNIIYPYKLFKGVSDQYIALELLKQKGFDESLVDRAMDVCNNLELKKNLKNYKKNINIEDKSKEVNINNLSNIKEKTTVEEKNRDKINIDKGDSKESKDIDKIEQAVTQKIDNPN